MQVAAIKYISPYLYLPHSPTPYLLHHSTTSLCHFTGPPQFHRIFDESVKSMEPMRQRSIGLNYFFITWFTRE